VRKVPLVMVVDDSITMRKVTGRVLELERAGVDAREVQQVHGQLLQALARHDVRV